MYDRPTAAELLQAVRHHLETAVVPVAKATHHKLYFQTLVSINVLKIVEREMQHSTRHQRSAWVRLDNLIGHETPPIRPEDWPRALAERNATLSADIRAGKHDGNMDLFDHLMQTAIAQLEVANPRFLAALQAEDDADR